MKLLTFPKHLSFIICHLSFVIIFLFFSFCFFLAAPNLTKPANAQTPTCTNNTPTVGQGGKISVGYSNIDVINNDAGVALQGATNYALTGTVTRISPSEFTLPPNVTPGPYNVVVVVVSKTNSNNVGFVGCIGKLIVTNTSGPANGGGADCTSFSSCISGITSPTTAYQSSGFVGALFTSILPIIIGIGGFLTVVIIVISGIQIVVSNGNPEAMASARGRLIFALVGFVILILAFAITQIVDIYFLHGSGAISVN